MIAILSANLNSFDKPIEPVEQNRSFTYHCFTDQDFPPITGLTPRLQYRIPKLFGWEMFQGYDTYMWLDGSVSFNRPDCLEWWLEELGDSDIAFIKHPDRHSIKEEADYIDRRIKKGNEYLINRYKNGQHQEQVQEAYKDQSFKDNSLYATTAFIYKNVPVVQQMMKDWWYYQSRYYTCDQVNLPVAIHKSGVKVKSIDANLFKCPYLSFLSKHK